MGIINCKECGIVCLENPSGFCPDCREKVQDAQEKIMNYLELHPGSALDVVVEATGAEPHIVMNMRRSGHLAVGMLRYACENCGELIVQGRLCDKCIENVRKIVE